MQTFTSSKQRPIDGFRGNFYISLPLTPPPLQTYIERKRVSYYTVVWEAAQKLMTLVWFFLGEGGGDKDKCMLWNPSINRYSYDVKVCIGFYLDSYSLVYCISRFNRTTISAAVSKHQHRQLSSVTTWGKQQVQHWPPTLHTVSAKKNTHFFKLVAELCQFLGGSWKVINNIQQFSQLLCTVNNRGSGLILSKNSSQLR